MKNLKGYVIFDENKSADLKEFLSLAEGVNFSLVPKRLYVTSIICSRETRKSHFTKI